jgi:3-hydroxyacyl-CoA dehydrogenase
VIGACLIGCSRPIVVAAGGFDVAVYNDSPAIAEAARGGWRKGFHPLIRPDENPLARCPLYR